MFAGLSNAYVTKLTADATGILYSTLFGVSGYVHGSDLELMPNGDLLLIGYTGEPGLIPLTPNALDTTRSASEGFTALITDDGTNLLYSSYIGGTGDDFASDVVVNSTGQVIVTGRTASDGFPTTPDALFPEGEGGAFLTVLDVNEPTQLFSSYLGQGTDGTSQLLLNGDDTVWILGASFSSGLAVTNNAYQSEFGGFADLYLTQVIYHLLLLFSTCLYFGGEEYDYAPLAPSFEFHLTTTS